MKNRVKEIILNPVSMFIIGLLTGFLVKEIDIHFYTQHFGMSLSDMFSKVGIWVLTGVAVSLYSKNAKWAMLNVFTFCIGMLITYYLTAVLTDSVFGWAYIKGWTVFACFSPLMAYLVTLTKRKGALSLLIKIGIFVGYIGINILLGGFIQLYDVLFFLILLYLLFIKKYDKEPPA